MSTDSARFSQIAHVFHGKLLPKPAIPAGYAWLIDRYALDVPLPPRLAGIIPTGQRIATADWLLLTPRYAPEATLADEVIFAIKWEGVQLAVLNALFRAVSPGEIATVVRVSPHGRFTRRLWFLYEWLTAATLDLSDIETKRAVVLALEPDQQYALAKGEVSRRHRVRNNLPGTPKFCPLVRVTPEIEEARRRGFDVVARGVIGRTHADVVARAAAFLELSDSKASFAIEHERPSPDRARRWAKAIARAGGESISPSSLTALQRVIIEDTRFVSMGIRTEGGFVGDHDRETYAPLPEHISARHEDLPGLMEGVVAFDARVREHGFDPVVAAASLAFGFVYIHPFVDGNGRLHRWLIHHVLAAMDYTPPGMVFPVSATMLRELEAYRRVLESYSRPLLDHIQWQPTAKGNVEVLNDTADFYRYFDATAHAEFLYHCVEETVDHDLPNELAYLETYDRFVTGLAQIVDMPQHTVELLHRFLRQNHGMLSQRARDNEFAALSADEVKAAEALFAQTTASPRQFQPIAWLPIGDPE